MLSNNKWAIEIALLRSMKKIRFVEEGIAKRYSEGKMRCPTHLSIGQEAVAAAVGLVLKKTDFAVSTHRSHGHYVGKGGNLEQMLSEIYGKASGCSKGFGGSMHLIDKSVGFMGSTAIVGGTIPIGVGLGLSIYLEQSTNISCVFLGDGATEEGVFYESVNFAVLKHLPVLFICENNLYSVYSSLSVRQPAGRKIHKMVAAMGCEAMHCDGNDAAMIYSKLADILPRMRQNGGPFFVELDTYRWREHCGPNYDNDIGYRTEEEFHKWKSTDPISKLEIDLLHKGAIIQSDIESIDSELIEEINKAFIFAEKSAFPQADEYEQQIYAGESHEAAQVF